MRGPSRIQEPVRRFLAETYDKGHYTDFIVRRHMFQEYREWARRNESEQVSASHFGRTLTQLGYSPDSRSVDRRMTRITRGLRPKGMMSEWLIVDDWKLYCDHGGSCLAERWQDCDWAYRQMCELRTASGRVAPKR